MIKNIVCNQCGSILGIIDKEDVTEADIEEYRVMVQCEKGCGALTIELVEEETP